MGCSVTVGEFSARGPLLREEVNSNLRSIDGDEAVQLIFQHYQTSMPGTKAVVASPCLCSRTTDEDEQRLVSTTP